MTNQALEFPSSPQVELRQRRGLSSTEISVLTAANSSADAAVSWGHALMAYRMFAIQHTKDALLNKTLLDDTLIRKTLDTAWQLYVPLFKHATAPMVAEAYIRAFRNVEAGRVPISMIYKLAEEHAERVGMYFNETSNEALMQGFNTYVNKQVPRKAALERVVDAYGLTPRQMSGFTSAIDLQPTKVNSSIPQRMVSKIKSYIGKSVSDRLKIFQGQEAHNLEEQANQVAWMWMEENNKLPSHTRKMWITARDEKVCKVCGPMDRKQVRVREMFELPNGNKLYVPGGHVNCRCTVRLQMNPFEIVGKAVAFDESEHRRSKDGRFTNKPKLATKDPRKLDSDMVRMLREVQQRDAIAAAKLQELREARLAKPKQKLSLPKQEEKLTSTTKLTSTKLPENKLGSTAKLGTKSETLSQQKLGLGTEMKFKLIQRAEEQLALHQMTKPSANKTKIYMQDDVPIGKPVFRVGESIWMDEEHADNRRAWFDEADNHLWTDDISDVTGEALDRVNDIADYEVHRIMTEHAEPGFEDHPEPRHIMLRDGNAEMYVPRAMVERAVYSVAFGEDVYPEDPEEPLPLVWTDSITHAPIEGKAQMTFEELASRINLNGEIFEQVIYYTEAGNSGQIEQIEAGSKYGYEKWRIWGGLRIISDSTDGLSWNTNWPIRWVELDSDTEVEEY